jgi:hypothetical protein
MVRHEARETVGEGAKLWDRERLANRQVDAVRQNPTVLPVGRVDAQAPQGGAAGVPEVPFGVLQRKQGTFYR